MQKNILETIMGAVVLIVAGFFLVFAYNGSHVGVAEGYQVKARFDNASGVSLGSDVRIGGVKVGVVSDMGLDPKTYQALVSMQIREDTKLPKDSSAAIVGDGLLGGKFIQISPGGDDAMMAQGDVIGFTQSAVNLEELIGKFVFSGGGVDKKDEKSASPAPTAHP
jgi:phospholipid/cholesterol/gamma-HCH transport system substrate-binding protein